MASASQVVLCRYRYDPLDRLAGIAPVGQADALRFYQKSRLATEIQGAAVRTIVQHEDLLLAQQQHLGKLTETSLLATDQQRSVLQLLDNTVSRSLVYTPYGHLPADSGLTSLLGFNGEHRDPITGHYMLGNGYRAFNPVLMRFNSPDSLSPFGEGGINAYAYCEGDPVNHQDPSGHVPTLIFRRLSFSWKPYSFRVAPTRQLYRGEAVGPIKVKLNRISSPQHVDKLRKKAVSSVNASIIQRGPETQGLRPELMRVKKVTTGPSVEPAYKRSIVNAQDEEIYLSLNEYAKRMKASARPVKNRELARLEDSAGFIRKPPAEKTRQEASHLTALLNQKSV